MLSVLIETRNDEERLAHTLASLVRGAVEGLVSEVIVCDLGSSDQTLLVADHAGCVCLESSDLLAGLRHAKGDWLMLIEPGARLGDDWTEAVRQHVRRETRPARFKRARAGRRSPLMWLFRESSPFRDGLVIARAQATGLASAGGVKAIARSAGRRRLDAQISGAAKKP